jgi:hypothetical protein
MRPRLPSSPARLIATAFLGTLISCALFLAPVGLLHGGNITIRLIVGFALLVAGLGLFLKSVHELKEGVRNQRWPDAQIAPLRAICESPFYTAFSIALLIAFAALAVPSTHFRALGWIFYLLSQALSQIRMALVPPRTRAVGPAIDWRSSAPIYSDHWGQR